MKRLLLATALLMMLMTSAQGAFFTASKTNIATVARNMVRSELGTNGTVRLTVTNATGTAVEVDWNGPSLLRLDLTNATAITFTNVPLAGSYARRFQLLITTTGAIPAVTISQTDDRQINWIDGGPYLVDGKTNLLNILFDGTNFLGSSAQAIISGSGFGIGTNSPSIFNLTALGQLIVGANTNSRVVVSNASSTGPGVWHLEGTNGAGGWRSLFSVNLTNGTYTFGFGSVVWSGTLGSLALPGSASVDSGGRFRGQPLSSFGSPGINAVGTVVGMTNTAPGRSVLRLDAWNGTALDIYASVPGALGGTNLILSVNTNGAVTLNSTNGALALMTMTKAQRDLIATPRDGSVIYQSDNTPGLRTWNGANWMRYTETAD